MNQPVTIDELIAALQERREVLGGDYVPRVEVDGKESMYMIADFVTDQEDCGFGLEVLYLHVVPFNETPEERADRVEREVEEYRAGMEWERRAKRDREVQS